MIVLDLEWSQPYGGGMEEILQIGAVRLHHLGAPLSGRFNVYIKPAIQKKLSPIARKLPDGRLSMTEGVPFAEGYEAFLTWCGGETVFAGWGGQDDGVLTKNARLWKLPLLEMPEYVDLQASFNRTLGIGTGRRLALENAVAYCGIPEVFEYHNALHDAMYAALVSGWIKPEAVEEPKQEKACRVRGRSRTTLEYPKQARQRTECCPAREDVLNSRSARFVTCPICQRRGTVSCWYPQGKELYYGTFCCEEHGRFPVRMAVVQRKDGQWQGRRTVPQVTEQERSALRSALPSEAEKVNERPPGSPGRALYMLFAWEKFLRSALYLGIIIQNMYYVLNPCGGSFFASQRTFALDRPLMAAGARSCIPPRSGRDRRWTRFW